MRQHQLLLTLVATALFMVAVPVPAGAAPAVLASVEVGALAPPSTPKGLDACIEPLTPTRGLLAKPGEIIEYDVEVMGVGLGTVEFSATREGSYQGQTVTELRGLVRVDRLISSLVSVEGAAAALVSRADATPVQATNRYRWAGTRSSEMQTYAGGGREVQFKRQTEQSQTADVRRFAAPVQDFLTGFYFLRRLDLSMRGCSVIFMNAKAYTVWLEPEATVTIDTPMGPRPAQRYYLRWASDEAKKVREARIWVGIDQLHLPYRGEAINEYHPRVELKRYLPAP